MKSELLTILRCPECRTRFGLFPAASDHREVRRGTIVCKGLEPHSYEIVDGIVRLETGFNHDAVRREIDYENSTYSGSERLTDPRIIAQFPDTLSDLWPHTCHFGSDFQVLIDRLELAPDAWVLDIGTGPCWSSRLLAQRGARVIALDVNEADYYGLKTSDILFEAHGVYFERILESMTRLPFKDSSVHAITFNASFHHTPDLEETLKECARVIRPDGVVAMVNEEFVSFRHRMFPSGQSSDTGSHHCIPYVEFEKASRSNGFSSSYFVADHVRKRLEGKLAPALGGLLVRALETFPSTLKQLNSALILLRKTSPSTRPTQGVKVLAETASS